MDEPAGNSRFHPQRQSFFFYLDRHQRFTLKVSIQFKQNQRFLLLYHAIIITKNGFHENRDDQAPDHNDIKNVISRGVALTPPSRARPALSATTVSPHATSVFATTANANRPEK
jgi:hypothetical protein